MRQKKYKSKTLIALTLVLTLLFGVTVHAHEPFDVVCYIVNNPDVPESMGMVGPDPNLYYEHYMTIGKAEGRKAVHDPSDKLLNQFIADAPLHFQEYEAEKQSIIQGLDTYNIQKGFNTLEVKTRIASFTYPSQNSIRFSILEPGANVNLRITMFKRSDGYYDICPVTTFTGQDVQYRTYYGPYTIQALKLFTKMIGDIDGSLAEAIIYQNDYTYANSNENDEWGETWLDAEWHNFGALKCMGGGGWDGFTHYIVAPAD